MTTDSVDEDKNVTEGQSAANPAQADRRLYRRYAIAIPAEIEANGERLTCAITDLSLGGVAVEPAFEACEVGSMCRLHCEDFYFDEGMNGKIVNKNAAATHIEFNLTEDMEAALTMFLVMSPATR